MSCDTFGLALDNGRPPTGPLRNLVAAAKAQAKDAGWAGAREPVVPGGRGGPTSGGLAVLARDGRRVARIPSAGRDGGRWLHIVVEAEAGRPLHVATVYGIDSGQPGAAEQNLNGS